MAFTVSPDMNLPIPNVGTEPGPNYAFDVNNCLTLIDAHDHTPGKGVPITPDALNINAPLDMQDQPLINAQSVVFFLQNAQASVSNSLYVFPGGESPELPDLWYYDGVTQIQITKAGNVNASAASIPGESYSGGTFFWKQGAGSTVPANFDIGFITLRPNVAGTTNGTTITGASSGAFSLALPNASVSLLPSGLPASTVLNTTDAAGNISTLAPGTSGQLLESQGTAGPPIWITPVVNSAPTVQIFSATGYYTFTTVALTVQTLAGATYTNNGQTFTVVYTANIGATSLVTSSTGAPTSSGSLLLSTGTGQATIVFSSNVANGIYQLPSAPAPLYIVVTGVGAGGPGTGGNTGLSGTAGGNTTFGSASMLVGDGGATGAGSGGAGGAGGSSTTTLTSKVILVAGGSGSGGSQSSGGTSPAGAPGGSSPFGGGGGSGASSVVGFAGAKNTGGGGGGGGAVGTNNSGSGGGSGGYFKANISSPSSTYIFTVGSGGTPGATSGAQGGNGGSGIIIVEEYYQ